MANLKVVDTDKGTISLVYRGHVLRSWNYTNEPEHMVLMKCAREYVEGWRDGRVMMAMDNPYARARAAE